MRKTSGNRSPFSPRALLASVIVIVVLVVVLLWRGMFAGMVWRVVTPLILHNPLSGLFAQLQSKATLANENTMLRAELASTTATLADRDVLYQENLELKARLGRDGSTHTLLAGVILRPPETPYDTLMIDAGKSQGVLQGALVSAGGTTLIGVVDQVYDSTARVVLFSAPGETYQALLMDRATHTSTPVSVEGQGNGSLVSEVPADTPAAVGDSVVFPGIAGGLVSTVVAVDAKSDRTFKNMYMQLPVNLQQLQFVEVLK